MWNALNPVRAKKISLSIILLFSTLICNVSVGYGRWYAEPTIGATMAWRVRDGGELTEQANFIALKSEYGKGKLHLLFAGEYRYDSIYDMSDDFSNAAAAEYRLKGTMEKLVLVYRSLDWDIALGWQKVAWGEADDLRVVDVINPLNLKDFVLLDLNEYRIAQNMLRFEGTLGNSWEIEGLWIFRFEGNEYPPCGSEFALSSLPCDIRVEEPEAGEFGFRGTTMLGDADVGLYMFHGYEDAPIIVLHDNLSIAEHKPFSMLGVSFNLPISSWVVRGEAALFPKRYLGTRETTFSRHHVVSALIGCDYLYQNWVLGFQLQDRYIDGWTDDLVEERGDTYITASVEGKSFADSLTSRVAFTWCSSGGDGFLSQLKLTYRPDRHWTLALAVDLMNGAYDNIFGQFSGKDRILFRTSYTF